MAIGWGFAVWLLACTGDTDTPVDTVSGTSTDTVTVEDPDFDLLPAGADPCRTPQRVDVDWVVDGDTLYATPATGGGQEKVRLIGIDTPELGWEGEPDDCFGPEAEARLDELVARQVAWLTFDAECYDVFGRTLAYVHRGLEPSDFVNRLLVQEGYATAFPVAPNVTFEAELAEDETEAARVGAGLWSACGGS